MELDELLNEMELALVEVDEENLWKAVSNRGFFLPSSGPYYIRIKAEPSTTPSEVKGTLLSLFRVRRDLCNDILHSESAPSAIRAIAGLSNWLARGDYLVHVEGKNWFAKLQVEMLARFGVAPWRRGLIFFNRGL